MNEELKEIKIVSVEELDKVLSKYFDEKNKENEKNFFDELDKILSKYFTTLEDEKELKEKTLNSENEIFEKIDGLKDSINYNNNQFHFFIVISLLIFFTVLFYKFIRKFI